MKFIGASLLYRRIEFRAEDDQGASSDPSVVMVSQLTEASL